MPGKKGTYSCKKHGQEFKRGHACPFCKPEDAEQVIEHTEASELAAEAMKRGLPVMLDHEKRYGELFELFKKREQQNTSKKKGAIAAMYGGLMMKAARAQAEITEWREDWIRTERESALGREDAAPRVPAPSDGARTGMH